ncbi:MAG: phosphoribosylamine--glycine ligase, partial [Alphaproteobacteria bacterium]
MKVLVVGSGGREHSLCWAIATSPLCDALYCAPGNAGIANDAICVAIGPEDIEGIVGFCRDEGIAAFGPTAEAAAIEGSKGFTKDLCAMADIPTAAYGRFTEPAAAK